MFAVRGQPMAVELVTPAKMRQEGEPSQRGV
jgi:hypothetical protein